MQDTDALVSQNLGLVGWTLNRFNLDRAVPDPEAVRQEAIVGLWLAAKDHQPGRAAFSTYAVLRIKWRAVAEVRRQLEHARREVPLMLTNEDGEERERPEVQVAPEAEARLARRDVAQLVRRLRPKERQVVAMRFGIDCPACSSEEVSERLGMSTGYVNNLVGEAIKKLRGMAIKRRNSLKPDASMA